MRRAMSLWLPTWSTDLVRRRVRRSNASAKKDRRVRPVAVLLTNRQNGREMVAHRCAQAAACGVEPGMDSAHARVLIPPRFHVILEECQCDRDAALLHRLAHWALRFSPTVAVDPPDGLLLDASGQEHLYGGAGERGLSRELVATLTGWGFAARAAIASTFAAAQALVRFARNDITHISPGGDETAIASLPVEALRVEAPIADAMTELGLKQIADVLRLPRAALASQFGDELLHRLDCLLGMAPELIVPVQSDPLPRAEIVFDGPTEHWETIEAAVRDVLDRLIVKLAKRGRGVLQLKLEALHTDRRVESHDVQLSQASRSRRHLWALLRPCIERVDVGIGVESVALTAARWRHLPAKQDVFRSFDCDFESGDEGAAWGELLDMLASRLGVENVVRFEPIESHLPERSFRERSIPESPSARAADVGVTPESRPTRLFAAPQPVHVMAKTPDGPILQVMINGRMRQVLDCRGPERLSAEWWRWNPNDALAAIPPDRDYFAVRIESGAWLWIFRQMHRGRWFVHGDWS